MDNKRYVIIGGSAAGMAAAETIRTCDPNGHIQVLSEEGDAPYFRPMIPFVVSRKKKADEISMQGQGPYRAENVEIRLATRVTGIDTRTASVITEQGESISYDRLLIATGSRPNIPQNITNLNCNGVFALRTLADARQASERAKNTTHAILLGGGLLNLKAAFALLERGIKVTLVVYSPEILSQLMEPADALLLRRALGRAGLTILTDCSAVQIRSDRHGVRAVTLDNGLELVCRMVCIGKGVRPNADWIDNNEITLDKGVVVDKYTCTGADHVYAAGDVAVTYESITGKPVVTGLWTNAVEMGRCAGANMAGRPTVYGGTFGIMNATQIARMPFVSMGMVHTTGTDYETHCKSSRESYRKLVFSPEGDRLIGALFIGDISGAGLYRAIIRERLRINEIKPRVIDHTLHYGHLLCAKGYEKGTVQ